ncbi:MAG: flagellar motor switch protein FliN [Geothrix sp.]|uniref:flagellar motor switch protein FliN n=1 Tax=Geothrix sp. TaxID=1962974 RepID=UPI00185BBFF7|nr:flagellar motor switch protein FliN [Geothrix sp.]NWJ40510.1 flagellar motor switch protein FliN [Geothrix sp.]WIL21485.1 MAG: flagellar motor switch protein FliN [Geothrix sp.]
MDARDTEFFQKVGSAFAESMASVFSMLTGREFQIKSAPGELLETPAVAALHEGTGILVKANYQKGLNGTLFFTLPLKEGTMLVDLMLGGEGAAAEELVGDSKDALAETFNQVLGSANQTLSDLAGETFAIANVEILAIQPEAAAFAEQLGQGGFQDLSLPTTQDSLSTTIHLLFPDLLLQQLKRKLGLVEAPPAPEPSPASVAATLAAPPRQAPVASGPAPDSGNLDLLLDIQLPVVVRMGQTEMQMGELLKLTPGSILELNRSADAPVELLVNGKLIAKGEVVVVDGNFAFRITEIDTRAARIRSLA